MPKKSDLLEKLCRKPIPKNFTKRVLQFDEPHPGNELYGYKIKKTIKFLKDIGEIEKKILAGR